jgi:catechol 2,3-dioxygenase-like lactoylglutathione lyase family enzyme
VSPTTADATFKDLCIDAGDPAVVARFWAAVLGLDVVLQDGGDAELRRDGLVWAWVNGVPEPRSVKNRVHLDLWAPDVRAIERLGAVHRWDGDGFVVLADPEGNEFCAFPPPAGVVVTAPGQAFALCTDSARPVETARWWADRTGATVGPGPDGRPRWLSGVPGLGDLLWKFVAVDDARTVKNRWHWDVIAEVEDLVAAGARVLRRPDADIGWTVLVDPDGNEFCAFAPGPGRAPNAGAAEAPTRPAP